MRLFRKHNQPTEAPKTKTAPIRPTMKLYDNEGPDELRPWREAMGGIIHFLASSEPFEAELASIAAVLALREHRRLEGLRHPPLDSFRVDAIKYIADSQKDDGMKVEEILFILDAGWEPEIEHRYDELTQLASETRPGFNRDDILDSLRGKPNEDATAREITGIRTELSKAFDRIEALETGIVEALRR